MTIEPISPGPLDPEIDYLLASAEPDGQAVRVPGYILIHLIDVGVVRRIPEGFDLLPELREHSCAVCQPWERPGGV